MAKTTASAPHTPIRQTPEKRQEIRDALNRAKLANKHAHRQTFLRKERKKDAKPSILCAYDFETTNIAEGTPRPLYLTAYSDEFQFDQAVSSTAGLHPQLVHNFLLPDFSGTKYVAWNGNRFDAYFVAAALITDDTYRLLPYMTRSKTLRGLRIELAEDETISWEFLDGISMTGLAGVSLEKFLANFAPDHKKLKGPDFEAGEVFDPNNRDHCAYAMRDSEGLYHGITRAQQIMLERFNEPLGVTMGGVCIKVFQAHIPKETRIEPCIPDLEVIVREQVMRGGFCYCVRRYKGPIWKYDINQAYAAAMREADLPAGDALHGFGAPPARKCFVVRCKGFKLDNVIPFYYRHERAGRITTQFSGTEIFDTWITSIEYHQLLDEGWKLQPREWWSWSDSFSMRDYVDKLERARRTCEGGSSGPIGTMIKATGNHSYGKTVEAIEPIEYVLAKECPEDCLPYYGDGTDPIDHIYYRIDLDRKPKPHHQPQIGAFITAHVRMVLRRAALLAPDAWLYADTDCVVFSRDVSDQLDIDLSRYGAWKIEEDGTPYLIIAKKVYTQIESDKPKRSAKGMNVKRLSAQDFADWHAGKEPVQEQIQINNFLSVLQGAEMYRAQRRKGTKVNV